MHLCAARPHYRPLTLIALATLALSMTACDKTPVAPPNTTTVESPVASPQAPDSPHAEQPTEAPAAPTSPTPPPSTAPVEAARADLQTSSAMKTLAIGDWSIHHSSAEAWAEHAKTKQKHVLYSKEGGLRDCKDGLEPEDKARADYQVTGALLSVVGDVVSYYTSEYGDCGGAHPFAYTGFGTLDLKTLKPAPLNSLFDDAQINAALDADAFVKKVRAKEQEVAEDCELMVNPPETKHTSFAFHHIKGDKVAVRMGLSHSYEVCRGTFAQVGLYLTPTAALMKQLKEAQAAGLLMNTLLPKLPQ